MRVFLDCTETYKTKLNTGIQRVVTQIAEHVPSKSNIKIIPIIFDEKGILKVPVSSLKADSKSKIHKIQKLLIRTPFYSFAKKTYNSLFSIFQRLKPNKQYVEILENDVILLADLVRNQKQIEKLIELNRKNIDIYQIIHDVLPLTFPQFFRDEDVENFKKLSGQWMNYKPNVITISKKVLNEIRVTLNVKNLDYFYLGSDFKDLTKYKKTKSSTSQPPFFLMVGTIEPRKNHKYILNNFRKLWRDGYEGNLVLLGRPGWKIEEVLDLMKLTQKEFPNRLLWIQDANDELLEHYYTECIATICASYDEGFGLPIVESLSRKKNVLCSDIAVFREIGGDFCAYFSLSDEGKTLCDLIVNNEFKIDLINFEWITWNDSIENLLNKMQRLHYSRE